MDETLDHNTNLHSLVLALRSGVRPEDRREAARELRRLTKSSSSNRILIGAHADTIPSLVELLVSTAATRSSQDADTQTHAVTALFNLSLRNEANRSRIASTRGAIDAFSHVLSKGASMEARENCAALICNLCKSSSMSSKLGKSTNKGTNTSSIVPLDDDDDGDGMYIHVGSLPKVVGLPLMEGLVSILRLNTGARAHRDAASAIYSLLETGGRAAHRAAIAAGAIEASLALISANPSGPGVLVDEGLALLTALCRRANGCSSLLRNPSALPTLCRILHDSSTSTHHAQKHDTLGGIGTTTTTPPTTTTTTTTTTITTTATMTSPSGLFNYYSPSSKEFALALLLLLCHHSSPSSVSASLRTLGAFEPVFTLSQCGTDRARRNAVKLLRFLV